jgi:tripartite ATP-independent transporter DctM subunit
MIGLGLMLTTRVLATRYNLPIASRRATWRERGEAFRKAALALVMPLILLGGMLSGFFTATEAAAVAAGYAIIVAPFVLRTVDFAEIRRIFVATAMQSGVILMLVGAAVTFAWLITVSGMAEGIAAAMLTVSDSPTVLLFLVNLLLLLIGMFLDAGPAILILGPVLAPIFVEIGVHPVHFALVMCINLTLGLATPPMGLVLFVTSSVSGVRIESIVRQMLPYLAVEILVLLLVTFIPALTLALPRALGLIQ